MKNIYLVMLLVLPLIAATDNSCDPAPSSDQKQHAQQEQLLQEATAQTGMPAIKNFRERKMLKDILELRDQDGLVTYTYLFAENTGKLVFLGETIGYGVPYATQYTNPNQIAASQTNVGYAVLPQADPNSLFSPVSAEGTWILIKGPNGKVSPMYVEPRIIVSTFKLNTGA